MRDIKVIKKEESKQFFEGDEQCNLYMKTEKMIFGTSYLEPGKEGTIDPGHKIGEEIFFVAKGAVTCQFSKLSKDLQEGDAVVIPIGEPHKLINKSKEEREARADADRELASAIERGGIEAFSRQWEANPLFATQKALPPALREAMRGQRLGQDPARLAAALRAFGTAFQPPAHADLARLPMPVLVMAGEHDAKFAAIARDMAGRIPNAALRSIAGSGHAVPLEAAQRCAAELEEFLRRSIDA